MYPALPFEEDNMIKEIIRDEAILSQPCEKATAEDAPLAQDLLDTLVGTEDAACLAANQIGVAKAIVAYLGDDEKPHLMYNPKLIQALHPVQMTEGCLSLEGESKVKRFTWIKVTFEELRDGKLVSRKRTFEGWTAELIQHMIDHCKGKLI